MSECSELIFNDGFAELWLNRPSALNALSRQLMKELDAAFAQVAQLDARALVLAGRGARAFCAGADIKEFKEVAATVDARAQHYRRDVCARIQTLSMPTVAAVHGYTFGGGLALALACDIRIAAAGALFSLPEAQLGTFPGMGVTIRLPRLIGRSEAMRLIFTAERIGADEALRIGLVNEVVPNDELLARARACARKISQNAPIGTRYAKEAVTRGARMPLEQGLRLEKDLNMLMETTADYVEGAKAFAERRKPRFKGH